MSSGPSKTDVGIAILLVALLNTAIGKVLILGWTLFFLVVLVQVMHDEAVSVNAQKTNENNILFPKSEASFGNTKVYLWTRSGECYQFTAENDADGDFENLSYVRRDRFPSKDLNQQDKVVIDNMIVRHRNQ